MEIKYDSSRKTMNVKEFAESYGIGINNAYTIVNSNKFPMIKVGRKILIITSKVDEWLENNIGNNF